VEHYEFWSGETAEHIVPKVARLTIIDSDEVGVVKSICQTRTRRYIVLRGVQKWSGCIAVIDVIEVIPNFNAVRGVRVVVGEVRFEAGTVTCIVLPIIGPVIRLVYNIVVVIVVSDVACNPVCIIFPGHDPLKEFPWNLYSNGYAGHGNVDLYITRRAEQKSVFGGDDRGRTAVR